MVHRHVKWHRNFTALYQWLEGWTPSIVAIDLTNFAQSKFFHHANRSFEVIGIIWLCFTGHRFYTTPFRKLSWLKDPYRITMNILLMSYCIRIRFGGSVPSLILTHLKTGAISCFPHCVLLLSVTPTSQVEQECQRIKYEYIIIFCTHKTLRQPRQMDIQQNRYTTRNLGYRYHPSIEVHRACIFLNQNS